MRGYQLLADSYAEIIGKVKLDEVKQPVLASAVSQTQINSDGALSCHIPLFSLNKLLCWFQVAAPAGLCPIRCSSTDRNQSHGHSD